MYVVNDQLISLYENLNALCWPGFLFKVPLYYVGGFNWMLGPRIGKFDKDGTPRGIPGHSLTIGNLDVSSYGLAGMIHQQPLQMVFS